MVDIQICSLSQSIVHSPVHGLWTGSVQCLQIAGFGFCGAQPVVCCVQDALSTEYKPLHSRLHYKHVQFCVYTCSLCLCTYVHVCMHHACTNLYVYVCREV